MISELSKIAGELRKRRFFLSVSTCCLLTSGCSFTDPEQHCTEQAVLGLRYYQSQNYSAAEKTYREAAETAKNSPNSLQYPLMLKQLARCLEAENKYSDAETALQASLKAYAELAKKGGSSNNSSSDERRYEALAALADCYMVQNKFVLARDTYAQAIALSKTLVEPMTISSDVSKNYILALEKCGQHELVADVQTQDAAATCTLEEFDQRLAKVQTDLIAGKFDGVEDELNKLRIACQGFAGLNPREGRLLTFIGLIRLTHNQPDQAEKILRVGLRNSNETRDSIADRAADFAMIGVAREMQGDTKSSIKLFKKAFIAQPYHPAEILSVVAAGLKKNGFASQAETVDNRIDWYKNSGEVTLNPATSFEFAQLAKEQERKGQSELASQSLLKGLQHLEKNKSLSSSEELRGAYRLCKTYRAQNNAPLAARALKQMRIIGNTSPERKKQLDQALRQFGLPLQ